MNSRGQLNRGDPVALELGEGDNNPSSYKTSLLLNVIQDFGLGRILWNDLRHGKYIYIWNVRSLYKAVSLKIVAINLAKYVSSFKPRSSVL
jgi:hypothetical protein